MNQLAAFSADRSGTPTSASAEGYTLAQPRERRRLQAYLARMLGDILSIFAGFALSGYFYLGTTGLEQAGILAQQLLPVLLTVALYNGADALSTLRSARTGALRGLGALGVSAAVRKLAEVSGLRLVERRVVGAMPAIKQVRPSLLCHEITYVLEK